MPKSKSAKRHVLQPQSYEHRVELVVESLRHAASGTLNLAEFLSEQAGIDWRNLDSLIVRADAEFARARFLMRRARLPPDASIPRRRAKKEGKR